MGKIEKDLAREFMREGHSFDDLEVINVYDNGDFVTFFVVSRFKVEHHSEFLDDDELMKITIDGSSQLAGNPIGQVEFDAICEVEYEVMYTDLNSDEFFFEPIHQVKETALNVVEVRPSDDNIDNVKLKEYLNEHQEHTQRLSEKVKQNLTINSFRPFGLEEYM